ncbi:MAG: tetratricopeptide repeat protein [Steroidobacteraceae bacterium]|jgi:tetratricopeptide (TPR) repeat protein|nr:tetratricopeptide repeat protein [Steroidobacteraceae bacterium]
MGVNARRRAAVAATALAAAATLSGCAAGAGPGANRAADPRERMLVAEAAIDRGQYPLAVEEYRLAAAATGDARLAERAARVAFDHGQDAALARVAREWLAREPDSEVARRFLAVASLHLDRVDDAEREYAKLMDTAYPTPAEGFNALLQSLADLRSETAAARVMARLAARHPDVPEAHYAAASLALQAGDSPSALAHVARAQQLRPKWREAIWLEVRARIAGRDCERGLAQSRGLAAEAADADRLVHAWLLTACERGAEARPLFEDLARGRVARAEALEGLAALEAEASRYEEAANRYTDLLATGRGTDRAFFGLGLVADRRGDAAQAVRLYSRVTSGSRAIGAQLRAYRLLLERGEADLAAAQFDEFVAQAPEYRIVATAGRAQVLAEEGRSADALALLDRALAAYPGQDELRYARAFVLEREGRVDAAIRELREVLKQRPEDPSAQNALGFTLADHGRSLPEAERLIRAALAGRPDSAAIQDSLGWVLHRRGRSAEALEWLARAFANEPDPEIAAHLGEVQWTLGQRDVAERTWRTALERTPDHRKLKRMIERFLGTRP